MNTQRKYTMQLVVVVQPPTGKSSFIATKEIKRSFISLNLTKHLLLKKLCDLKSVTSTSTSKQFSEFWNHVPEIWGGFLGLIWGATQCASLANFMQWLVFTRLNMWCRCEIYKLINDINVLCNSLQWGFTLCFLFTHKIIPTFLRGHF